MKIAKVKGITLELSYETIDIINRLDRSFRRKLKTGEYRDHDKCVSFQSDHGMKGWEVVFFPEEMYYGDVLEKLGREDIVFDVGAGDLRFDLIMAEKVRKVYAVEINPTTVAGALRIMGYDLPGNVVVICGDAFEMELPPDVTAVTCLMIHRQHSFPEKWKKCRIIYATHEGVEEL